MARPKKSSTAPPSYRLHKTSGQAIVTLNGKTHYLGLFDTPASRDRYDRLVAEWLARGRTSPAACPHTITVAEVLAGFWTHISARFKPNSLNTYKLVVRTARLLYGEVAAAEFGPLKFRALRQHILGMRASARYGARTYARCYVNDSMNKLVQAFAWAESREMIPPGVCHALREVEVLRYGEARESEAVKPVRVKDVDATLPHLLPATADMVRLQMLTGMRPGEVCCMRTLDVDTRGDRFGNWVYTPPEHKTAHHGKTRTILIGPVVQGVLGRHLRANLQEYVFSPRRAVQSFVSARRDPAMRESIARLKAELPERFTHRHIAKALGLTAPAARYYVKILSAGGAVRLVHRGRPAGQSGPATRNVYRFSATVDVQRVLDARPCHRPSGKPYGERYRTSAYCTAIANAVKRADAAAHKARPEVAADEPIVRHWHPHQLRHTFATASRAEGGLEVTRAALGHSSVDTTLIYAEPDMEALGRLIQRIG